VSDDPKDKAAARKDSGLDAYRAKRTAGSTPEPMASSASGGMPAVGGRGPRMFVVHQHDATRMHWDLRLEIDGVLCSWAVPKEPSMDPDDKRLAVKVENHPLEYVHFEAVIPDGNYGAGPMIAWDRGLFRPLIDAAQGMLDGEIKFELYGYKLRGAFTLVHTGKGRGGRNSGRGRDHWLEVQHSARGDSGAREFLAAHAGVDVVHWPGLTTHRNHAIAARQMRDFGGMLSVRIRGGRDAALKFAGKLRLFTNATSLGGCESLIEHRASVEGPQPISPDNLLRVSVGLEHAEDLIDDLRQALG